MLEKMTCIMMLSIAVFVLSTDATAQLVGTVLDGTGRSLADASVWSDGQTTKTDRAGEFVFAAPSSSTIRVVRVSAPGYRPITRVVPQGSRQSFMMTRSADALWKISTCRYERGERPGVGLVSGSRLYGARVRLEFPIGTPVQPTPDLEHSIHKICHGNDCLQFAWGGGVGDPIGSVAMSTRFADIRSLRERDVYDVPHGYVDGAEYRGIRTDGTYFRWIGVLGESVTYDRVGKASATFLDRVIDSICWFTSQP